MEIRRTVTKVYKVTGITLDMFTYDVGFRHIRARFNRQHSSCFNCGHKYEDGEKISLAEVEARSNETLCHDCAVQAKGQIE